MVGMLHITPGKAGAFLISKPFLTPNSDVSNVRHTNLGLVIETQTNSLIRESNVNMSTQRKLARGGSA